MDLQFKSLPFACKAEGDGSEFSGYCAVFHNLDSYGDIIMPGAFAKTLPTFLASGQILFNHGVLIGKPIEAREDAKGLFIRGKISDTADGRDVKTLLKDGVLRKMSIGYRTVQSKGMSTDDVLKYWAEVRYQPTEEDAFNLQKGGAYGFTGLAELKLYEASPVAFPANTQADITGVKSPPRLSEINRKIAWAEAEVKAGRTLSRETHSYLKAVREAFNSPLDRIDALLDQHDPDASDDAPEGNPDDQAKADLDRARAELSLHAVLPIL